jgi:hypothetical protein
MADSEEIVDKCHKEILAFEANMKTIWFYITGHCIYNSKMIEIKKEKMAATKKANEGFAHAFFSISKAMT